MGKNKGHIPIRKCVSCGAKRAKDDLFRLSLNTEGSLVVNISDRTSGRGVYVCKTDLCRERLKKNKRLNRVFRTEGIITISPVYDK